MARVVFACSIFLLLGCRELPPDPAPSVVEKGWPPPSRYAADRLHPANRWCHRIMAQRSEGRIIAMDGEEIRVFEALSSVDRAEIFALLDAIVGDVDALCSDARAALRRDLSSAATQLEGRGDADLAVAHRVTVEQISN